MDRSGRVGQNYHPFILVCFNDLAAGGNICHPDPQGPGLPLPLLVDWNHQWFGGGLRQRFPVLRRQTWMRER
ncbi:hypothetical protein ACSQ67_020384 [Phaseolus vulgaris]